MLPRNPVHYLGHHLLIVIAVVVVVVVVVVVIVVGVYNEGVVLPFST